MASIELYKSKINSMSNYIAQAKSAVSDFCVDLSALKKKILGINSSVCDNIVTSISSSSKTQEEQIAGLEATQKEVNAFIQLAIDRDNSASSEIAKQKKDFYKKYSYLKPECEKSKWEKFCDGLKKVGEWCKDHWKEIVVVLEIVAAVVCLCVPGLQGIGTGILIGMLKGVLSGAIIGGLASWAAGGSIWEGIYQGAVGGAMFGGLFGAFGAAGSMFGATSSHMCQLLNGFEKIASVTGKLSMGLMSFDIASLGLQVLKKSTGYSNPLFDAIVATNNKCHSSTLYNITQTALALTAVTTGSAAKSARATGNTCFIAGTMVLTASGLIAIENVKIGDKVISADIETGNAEEKTVLETYVRKVDKLIHLVINGEEIVTTEDHPFFVQGRGFIEAGKLFIGDKLVSVNGDDLFIDKCDIEHCEKPVTVYNFNVEDYHSYFVGEFEVLVHNIEYVNNSLPNTENATINPDKLTKYALNPDHPVGGNKARVFKSVLGYDQSNANELMEQIYRKLPGCEAKPGTLDQYGQRYTVDIPIDGANGNTANVRTGWIIKTNSDIPELTTLYVH